MPKGKPLANMMDNEVVEVLYTCMKHGQNGVDFNEVAKELGLKDASTAKSRLVRVMKAQEKSGTRAPTAPVAPPTKATKLRKPAAAKKGGKTKAKVIKNEDGDSADDQVNGDSQDGEADGEDNDKAKVKDEMDADGDEGRNGAEDDGESSKEDENSRDQA